MSTQEVSCSLKNLAESILNKCLKEKRNVKEILNNNYVYVTDDSNKPYMVKFMCKEDRRKLEIEKAMFEFVSEKTGISVPQIIESGECEYGVYMAREMIEGNSLDSYQCNSREMEEIYFQAGQILAKLHSLEFKDRGIFKLDFSIEKYDLFTQKEYQGFIEKLYNKNVIPQNDYKLLSNLDMEYYFGSTTNVFCHSDYNPKNIIVKDSKITSIIDFEWACSAPPWDDMATFHLFAELYGFERDIKSFYEGYKTVKGIDATYFQGLEFYKFYRLITMLSYQITSGYRFQGDFQNKMLKKLEEMLKNGDLYKGNK